MKTKLTNKIRPYHHTISTSPLSDRILEKITIQISMGVHSSPCRIGLFLYSLFLPVILIYGNNVENLLKEGMTLLANGQLPEAAQKFQAAIDIEPNNYQALYRQATVYLAMGRPDAAVDDLTKVINLKPDFISAVNQRGGVYLKQCKLEKAREDYKTVHKHEKNSESKQKIDLVTNIETWLEYANDYFENNDYSNAVSYLSKAIEHCQWAPHLYKKRAVCYEENGEIQKAITDFRAVTKLTSDSREIFLKVSKLHYLLGDAGSALIQIRECLKLDPDDKECFVFFKKVKKIDKLREQIDKFIEKKKWMECLEKTVEVFKAEKENERIQLDTMRYSCKCNMKAGHTAEAIRDCSEVLKNLNADDVEVLVDRAEAYILDEDYEAAVNDYKRAHELDENNNSISEGLQKAQRLLKQSKKKDYYKILGLKRNAKKSDVMKAYRKLARKWHPDNFQNEEEKKKAEKMFIDIAAAKEVLTDPEKKAQFDNGQDPLDPESQQGSHAHPFHQGFHFHQGGFGGFDFGDGGSFGGFKFTFG